MHIDRRMLLALVLILGVAIAAPVTWYLASPLWIHVELDEPAPALAGNLEPARTPSAVATPPADPGSSARPVATAPPTATPVVNATADPIPTPDPTAAPLARQGRFRGADDFHFGRGRARLLETAPGSFAVRFEDFAVRNGPDLYVYLSPDPDGYAEGAIELGRLRATDGNFNTRVPDGIDVSVARSVVIWCKQFSVLFAVARLEP